jgi:hypothetical protein
MRLRRLLMIICIYPAWQAMMALHEAGHCIHAQISGGQVQAVVIPLMGFSRTDLSRNPHPLFVAWGGPLWGVLIPLLLLLVARFGFPRFRLPATLFAGFCLIANGAYIGLGPLMTAGDGHDLLRHGAPAWSLFMCGAIAFAGGMYLWHRSSLGVSRRR